MPTDPEGGKSRGVVRKEASASPAATGPAGPLLETHVGAQYLLPLLTRGEARGLPGVAVNRVQFQRGALGFPLDDVIVTGTDARGETAFLEIQVKRSLEFTPSDPEFARVVAMACHAATKPEFAAARYEVAVALGHSARIDRHVRAVLQWARDYQDHDEFFRRLAQPRVAHQNMRDFADAFRAHMRASGARDDPSSAWRLLRRFQVLTFDAEDVGSPDRVLARERCVALLSAEGSARATELWDSLGQIALQVDAVGGDLDAPSLQQRLTSERGFRFVGDRQLRRARTRVADATANVLAAINVQVHGVRLDREEHVEKALAGLEQGRYLEIRGLPGVGKSGILRALAGRMEVESRVIAIAPHRVTAGGWVAWQAQLGCDASARDLLLDLAADGGATLFIDGLDRFEKPAEQATVVDLLRAAAEIDRFKVVVTARFDFDADAAAWLPADAIERLGRAPVIAVDALSETDVEFLRSEDRTLASLLRPGHPAEKLVRNLYRLERLARVQGGEGDSPFSEAQMARQWWESGDSPNSSGRLERRRALHSFALQSLMGSGPLDISACPAASIEELAERGTLRLLHADHAEFVHDVLRDWAIACVLFDEPRRVAALPLREPATGLLARGVELLAQLLLEQDASGETWRGLLTQVSGSDAHGSWRRITLLALTRSERALDLLQRCEGRLLGEGGLLLVELTNAAITVDSRPAADFWRSHGVDVKKLPAFPSDYVIPNGPSWQNLLLWTLVVFSRLPHAALPTLIDLYGRWCAAFTGQDALAQELVKRLYIWLVQVDKHANPPTFPRYVEGVKEVEGIPFSTTDEMNLRQTFLLWCGAQPELADAYLRAVAAYRNNHAIFRQFVGFVGGAPRAAPGALVDLFLSTLQAADRNEYFRSGARDVFGYWDTEFFPPSPARPPFFELLMNAPREGLRFVHDVVAHAVRRRSGGRQAGAEDAIRLELPGGSREFQWQQTYRWSRDGGSNIVTSALMALEAWGNVRADRGDPIDGVISDVLGPPGTSAAFVLVAIDIMLSHWPASREILWRFAANAELLALDRERFGMDTIMARDQPMWVRPEPLSATKLADLRRRPSRRFPLDAVLDEYGRDGPAEIRNAIRDLLATQRERLGPPDDMSQAMADPRFAAMSGCNRMDPGNHVQSNGVWEYVPPPEEGELLRKLQEAAAQGHEEVVTYHGLVAALDAGPAQPALLQKALTLIRAPSGSENAKDAADQDRARWILAALILRDGDVGLVECHAWCREQLQDAARQEFDSSGHVPHIPYNSASIAGVGLLAAHRRGDVSDLETLLRLAVHQRSGMASVLEAEIKAGRSVDGQLACALMRLGLTSEIYAIRHSAPVTNADWRERQALADATRAAAEDGLRQQAVQSEMNWLTGQGPEPVWPKLPDPEPPRSRRNSDEVVEATARQRWRARQTFALDADGASRWLGIAATWWAGQDSARLRSLLKQVWPWTAAANGAGADRPVKPTERTMQWNSAFFRASVDAAAGCSPHDWDQLVMVPLSRLADDALFDSIEAVVHQLDFLWIDKGRVSETQALGVRERTCDLLRADPAWQWMAGRDPSHGAPMHLGGAIAALFFAQNDLGRGPRCYLSAGILHHSDSFLPKLVELAKEGAGSTFVAFAFLELLEVSPRVGVLSALAEVLDMWWNKQSTSAEFWLEHGVGPRVSRWVKAALASVSVVSEEDIKRVVAIADVLLRCGVPEAKQLEELAMRSPP